MNWFSEMFGIDGEKSACRNTAVFGCIRVSVITDRLIRVEHQPDLKFCDKPTQSILYRDLNGVNFSYDCKRGMICIWTDRARLIISESDASPLQAKLDDGRTVTDFETGNLHGTVRTLDKTDGPVELGDGIISESGAAVLDDSTSLILCKCGRVLPREKVLSRNFNGTDKYYFLYGYDYIGAVRDLYRIAGSTPLIPRYTLGNWWSRYKAYSQDEYLTLMRRFKNEEIPITVATVDMDWHWVKVEKEFGPSARNKIHHKYNPKEYFFDYVVSQGWTGYSWNTHLFPDYRAFLDELNAMNYKVTLNLHPASGVRWFEDMYDEFADFMGVDKSKKEQIGFDITDPKFVEGYFKFIHHKYEDEGVAFWWLDWQQGNCTSIDGLDPLWALNHYHLLDNGRDNRRGLILSRFAGAGSHRYPLGFSGDTTMCWDTLNFQPYFTATASNIGYSWWSHDIGGHCGGAKNDELYLRWVQFGIFSPIMRLHSTSNEFMGKEPWKYSDEANRAATAALRFRHRMLPYLYTMNYRTAFKGRALMEPMYYHYPKAKEAYEVGNEYFFGSQLIVIPITEPHDEHTLLAGAQVWIPSGRYTDIFTGRIYEGPKKLKIFRDNSSIPVLAKAGAIIPLSVNDKVNDWKNPTDMELLIYRGDNSFEMYEDDGISNDYKDGKFCKTRFDVAQAGDTLSFTVETPTGYTAVIPRRRKWLLSFRDITDAREITVLKNGEEVKASVEKKHGFVQITVSASPKDNLTVTLEGISVLKNPPRDEMLTELISKFQYKNTGKLIKYYPLLKKGMLFNTIPSWSKEPIKEILYIASQDE